MTTAPTICGIALPLALLLHALCMAQAPGGATQPDAGAAVQLRGSMANSRIVFEREKKGHVAFMGGSITEMNGFRPLVCADLRRRFPGTQFTFTNAGVASTCSTTGAFRLATDVLSQGPVDLFFVEFAVNDEQDAHHARRECIRGMEGIVRQVRRHNLNADIVIVHFVNPDILAATRAGRTPLTIEAHESVAGHYGVSSVNVAAELARRAAAGTMTWEQFGGTHPGPAGNALAAGMIGQLLDRAWAAPWTDEARKSPHPQPAPRDPLCYENGRFVDPQTAQVIRGWAWQTPDWAKLKGGKRERFTKSNLLCADQPGAELTLKFTGTAVGAYVVAGPDAGVLEASVDGGVPVQVNLYHSYSANLHYPRTVMFATDLKPGEHALGLRVSDKTTSAGHAARIVQFAAN